MDDHTDLRSRPARVATKRGRGRLWIIAGALAVVVLLGLWLHERSDQPATSPRRAAANEALPVSTALVTTGTIRVILDGLGTVTPLATVTVRTQISGDIMQIGFTEGQLVHKGDFLVQIDPRPYQVALETAQGNLARDQALLGEARTDLARYQNLSRLQSIAQQQAADQAFLVKQYAGTVVTDQAAIDSAKLNLIYCHITSPIDGRVGLRQVDLGNFVQPSDTNGLVVVTQLQPMSIEFALPEDDIPVITRQMRRGRLAVLAYDRTNTVQLASGTLDALDTEVNNTTGTVTMRAMFSNTDNALFPQQFVNVQLVVQVLSGVVTAPVAAVQHGAPGAYVYAVGADHVVHVVTVQTGPTDGERVQIVAGLSPGQRVVTDGTDRLKDGAKVSVP